jgi:hypothetical protein
VGTHRLSLREREKLAQEERDMEPGDATETETDAFERAAADLRPSWDAEAIEASGRTAETHSLPAELDLPLPRPPRTPRVEGYLDLSAGDSDLEPAGLARKPRLVWALAAAAATVLLVVAAFATSGGEDGPTDGNAGELGAEAAASPLANTQAPEPVAPTREPPAAKDEPRAEAVEPVAETRAAASTEAPDEAPQAPKRDTTSRRAREAREAREAPRPSRRAGTVRTRPESADTGAARRSKRRAKKGAGFVSESPY